MNYKRINIKSTTQKLLSIHKHIMKRHPVTDSDNTANRHIIKPDNALTKDLMPTSRITHAEQKKT